MTTKTGINYPDLEPGNKFWNQVRLLLQITSEPTLAGASGSLTLMIVVLCFAF